MTSLPPQSPPPSQPPQPPLRRMITDPCEGLTDLLPAYLFGFADPDERARTEQLMADCPEMADWVAQQQAEYAAVETAMLEAAPSVQPPVALKNRLMAAIASDAVASNAVEVNQQMDEQVEITPSAFIPPAQQPPVDDATRVRSPRSRIIPMPAQSAAEGAGQKPSLDKSELERRASSGPTMRAIPLNPSRTNRVGTWAALAGVAVAALLVTNVFWLTRPAAQSTLTPDTLAVALANGSLRPITLVSTSDTPPLATVFFNPTNPAQAVLYSDQLPELEDARTYQLWLIEGEQNPVSAGVFGNDTEGPTLYTFTPSQPLEQYDAIAISEEPQGGSDQPTTTPIALGNLSV